MGEYGYPAFYPGEAAVCAVPDTSRQHIVIEGTQKERKEAIMITHHASAKKAVKEHVLEANVNLGESQQLNELLVYLIWLNYLATDQVKSFTASMPIQWMQDAEPPGIARFAAR